MQPSHTCFQHSSLLTPLWHVKNDVLTETFNMSVPPAASLVHSRGSSRELRQTSQTGTGPATVLADCQRSASSPPLTTTWMIRLAWGQRLPALRTDTETRGGRKWNGPEGKLSHMVPQVYCWNRVITEHFSEIVLVDVPFTLRNPLILSIWAKLFLWTWATDLWPWLQRGKAPSQPAELIFSTFLLFQSRLGRGRLYFG